jgi:hypothetical protein
MVEAASTEIKVKVLVSYCRTNELDLPRSQKKNLNHTHSALESVLQIRSIQGLDKTGKNVRFRISEKRMLRRILGPKTEAGENVIMKNLIICTHYHHHEPIRVAVRSKAWTVFTHSNTGVVGSNPTRGMDFCVRLFCVCVVLCVSSGLATG